jgi:hypothetical protein
MKIRAQRMRALMEQRPHSGKGVSMFYGDPVEISDQQVADVISNETAADDAIVEAAAANAATEAEAVDRANEYTALSRTERSEITVLPPLSLTNAVIIVKPVVKGLSANNLNYLLQKAMVDYPGKGMVKVATPWDPSEPDHYAVTFKDSDVEAGGLLSVPFFRFNLSASTLNSRPGGNYNIWVVMKTENGESITTEPYTFQRIESTSAVLGIMIPFRVVATRTLPALGVFGTNVAQQVVSFEVHVTGMDPNGSEILSVTQPGYATAETKIISDLFSLPAGTSL